MLISNKESTCCKCMLRLTIMPAAYQPNFRQQSVSLLGFKFLFLLRGDCINFLEPSVSPYALG